MKLGGARKENKRGEVNRCCADNLSPPCVSQDSVYCRLKVISLLQGP